MVFFHKQMCITVLDCKIHIIYLSKRSGCLVDGINFGLIDHLIHFVLVGSTGVSTSHTLFAQVSPVWVRQYVHSLKVLSSEF
jgi:hypothetical protein